MVVQYQLGRSLRLLGENRQSLQVFEGLLTEKPTMLDAQTEAALAYEQWAAEPNVLPVDALKIEEIPGAENPLTRDAEEMHRFLNTVNRELRKRGLPLFDVIE